LVVAQSEGAKNLSPSVVKIPVIVFFALAGE
jgi:hypothetical protein